MIFSFGRARPYSSRAIFRNCLRIALQILHVLLQFQIFLVELFQFLADLLNLQPLLPHRQVAVRPENIVHQQHRHKHAHRGKAT